MKVGMVALINILKRQIRLEQQKSATTNNRRFRFIFKSFYQNFSLKLFEKHKTIDCWFLPVRPNFLTLKQQNICLYVCMDHPIFSAELIGLEKESGFKVFFE